MRRCTHVAPAVVVVVVSILSACGSSETTKDVKATAAPKPISAEERVQWYQQCWNYFNDKKWSDFRQCYADNATSQQLGYGKPVLSGADAIVASSQDFAKMAPDGRGAAQLILVNGTHMASIFLLSGANSGPLTGPDGKEGNATNRKFGLLFGHTLELDPAAPKVVKELGVMDSGSFAYQLGLSPEAGRPVMSTGVAAPLVVMAKNDATEISNVKTDEAAYAAWNTHRAADSDAFNAPDLLMHDTTQPKDTTRAQNSAMNAIFWKGFSDARLTISSIWAAGDYVAATGMFEGTNDGDFPPMHLKNSKRKISLPFLEIDRFEAGKVKEAWFFMDGGMLASQLMAPASK